MKKILLTLALTLVAVVSFGQNELPIDEKIRVGKLENGLTYYICHNETQAGMADFYLLVDVGAAQETDAQDGFAHFVEHMCFNGTKNFPGKTLIEFFASLGCAFSEGLNARTELDKTYYVFQNIPVTREGVIDSCLLALHDISHYATFDYSEIEAERGVIIEELRSKGASRRITIKSWNYIYAGTPLANRTIIGSEEQLKTFNPDDLVEFYRTWYQPDVQAVVVIGDVDTDLVEQKIKNTFSAIPVPDKPTMKPIVEFPVRQAPEVAIVTDPGFVHFESVFNWINKTISKELASTSSALCCDVAKKLVAGIFNERIGRENCLSFNTFCDGYEHVSCGLVNDSSLKNFRVLCLEIERMRRYGVTEDELNRAKRKIISDAENLVRERMNVEYRDSIFNHFLYNRYLISPETELDLTKAFCELITPEELMEFIHHFTNDENWLFIYAAPERENIQYPTKEKFLSTIEYYKGMELQAPVDEAFDSTLLDTLAIRPGKIENEKEGLCGSTEWVLDNGVKVIFKRTSYKNGEVNVKLVKEGGRTLLDTHELPFFEPNLFNGFQTERVFLKFSKKELMKRLSGMSVQCLVFFNEQQHGISASATPKDIEIAMQLLYMNIAARKFDKESCQNLINSYKDQYEGLENHASYVSQKIINQTFYENQERRQMPDAEMLKNVNADDFENAINRLWGDVAGATVYIVGDIDAETLKPLVEKYIASLPGGKKGSMVIDRKDGYIKGRIVKSESIKMVTPKSVISQLYSAHIPYSVKNQVLLEIVQGYLSILYFNTIREELGENYSTKVDVAYQSEPKPSFELLVTIPTNPTSADAIAEIAVKGVESIAENGVPDDKLKNVVKILKNEMKQKKENNEKWMQILEKSYKYNEDYIGEYEKALNSVTSDDVRKFVKEILKQDNFIQLIINPE